MKFEWDEDKNPDLQQMWKGVFIMTKTFIIESGQKPTEEQLKEIEEAQI